MEVYPSYPFPLPKLSGTTMARNVPLEDRTHPLSQKLF